ncbi:LPXTG cell wall anchor domain-containing protein [Streptococcus infantis]|uniref:LPXTG cell wall anchor domain-containing protein n=1 Tax=Streptococcus infantis TaxID=68892 RepID=UPI001BDB2175|nr:LPXTG cell wall anchor domain-containing protein [Streptococcus infantis]MBT0951055.1 LPXTG cell wall anchor domain-containing protein [Streptococcus infantis]
MKNQKRFGKLLITLLSTGVLLAALQSQEIITAEETTTAEQISTTSAEAVTTTETPAREAREVAAEVTGTIKNHDIKYFEYYTDVDLSFSITEDDVKEGDYVTVTLENVAILNQLNGKDVTYEGKTIGKISIVSFENVNKARQGSNDTAQMRQAQLESTRATLKITFTKAIEAEKPDVLKQVKFQIKSDNAYNGAVIANKDYTLNQVIKVGSSSVTSTVDIPKVEQFATDTNSINMPPSGNTIKFNADGSYETYTEFQVRGSEGMKVGSTVELEFNDASGIEWKTSGDTALKVGDTFTSRFILPVYSTYEVNEYGAYVFPTGVEPTFKVTSISEKKITMEMISGDVPKELGVFFGVGQNRINIIDKSKIDLEKMQYDVSKVATATIDGKDSKGIYIYRIINDSAGAQLVLDTLVTDYKDIDTKENLKPQDKGWKDPATIDGYEFVKTEKDREGNRIHWYKKVEQTTTTTTTTQEPTTTTTTTTVEPTTTTTTTTTTQEPTTTTTTTTGGPTTTTTTTQEPTTTTTTSESTTTTTTGETTPGKSSEETTSGKTTEETKPETTSTTVEPKKELPNTGSKESLFATGVALLVAGLGVLGLKKKDN